jgi:hypothetical protein
MTWFPAKEAAGSNAAWGDFPSFPFWAAKGRATRLLLIVVLFVGAGLASSSDVARAQQGVAGEYQVKAAFLYNFGKFIEWPQDSLGDATAPLTICTRGNESFPETLEQTVQGKLIQGHPLRVRRWEGEDASQCQILFIGASEKDLLPEITRKLQGIATLTVGEAEGFAQSGGMINFVVVNEQVRFEINQRSARKSGLRINSRLLSLATEVWE